MKTLATLFILLCFTASGYTQSKCIPFLLYKENKDDKIYIKDPCVDDTITILFRAGITFRKPLLLSKPVVESVVLHDLWAYLTPNSTRILIEKHDKSPFNQYIWNLCYAKICYWYKKQPYAGWLNKDLLAFDSKLYMGAVFYIVPNHH